MFKNRKDRERNLFPDEFLTRTGENGGLVLEEMIHHMGLERQSKFAWNITLKICPFANLHPEDDDTFHSCTMKIPEGGGGSAIFTARCMTKPRKHTEEIFLQQKEFESLFELDKTAAFNDKRDNVHLQTQKRIKAIIAGLEYRKYNGVIYRKRRDRPEHAIKLYEPETFLDGNLYKYKLTLL
jgi:hypothetical protein